MKMPEKHDLLAAILAAKERYQGNPCVCNGVPSADIMAVRLQSSNRRNDVRHYRLVHS